MHKHGLIVGFCILILCCILSIPVYGEDIYDIDMVEPAMGFAVVSPIVESIEDQIVNDEPEVVDAPIINVEYSTNTIMVDPYLEERNHIAQIALTSSTVVNTYSDCARWVYLILQEAGWVNAPYWSGAMYWEHFADSTHTVSNIPVGSIVIGTGHNSDTQGTGYYYGHVGICVGDTDGDGEIEVRDCIGPGYVNIRTQSLSTWLSWQTDSYLGYTPHVPGFVGWIYYPELERATVDFPW